MFADMMLIIEHVETIERKKLRFRAEYTFLFKWRAAIMFDEGAICIESLFFDNEVTVDHILFVLLYKSI